MSLRTQQQTQYQIPAFRLGRLGLPNKYVDHLGEKIAKDMELKLPVRRQ